MPSIRNLILSSIQTKLDIAKDTDLIRTIENSAQIIISRLRHGNKLIIAGNGGSAADAQHFAAELAGKFIYTERVPLPAIALTVNTSIITAIGNDFGYNEVFSRQVRGLGITGDIFFGISTSGNSENILQAMAVAKEKGLTTMALLGNNGGKIKYESDIPLIVPSSSTQNIQEAHIMIIHIICQIIDEAFIKKSGR